MQLQANRCTFTIATHHLEDKSYKELVWLRDTPLSSAEKETDLLRDVAASHSKHMCTREGHASENIRDRAQTLEVIGNRCLFHTDEATCPEELGHGAAVLQQLTFCSPELKADDCFETSKLLGHFEQASFLCVQLKPFPRGLIPSPCWNQTARETWVIKEQHLITKSSPTVPGDLSVGGCESLKTWENGSKRKEKRPVCKRKNR